MGAKQLGKRQTKKHYRDLKQAVPQLGHLCGVEATMTSLFFLGYYI